MFIILLFNICISCVLANSIIEYDQSNNLNCLTFCNSYHAGASINSTMVCTYQASGVGTLKQNLDMGTSCYPAYNCREDWNICIQNKSNSLHQNILNLSNQTIVSSTCMEILNLKAGGNSGDKPPDGGWKPTSLDWRKGSGNIGCGWGSTFSDVERNSQYSLEDFGRVVIDDFQGNEVDCCIEAMKYEATDISHGGAAIRFDLYNGNCRIDREIMMRGNLDTSSGRPLCKLEHCGNDGIDYFYWRNAAGAADAANLQIAGVCSKRHNFTRIVSSNSLVPLGRLPDGPEIPNRLSECEGEQPEMCLESLRYNSINTIDECCMVCTELRWLHGNNINNPCVAFQIVDGKCRILREKWFTIRYGSNNLGNNVKGNKAMTVSEVVDVCAGFKDHDTCARKDNSHGYWGSCSNEKDVTIDNDCSYFSHIYFRDPKIVNFNITIKDANVSFNKVQDINLVNKDGTLKKNLNLSINTTIMVDRTTKRQTLNSANVDDLPIGAKTRDTKLGGYIHIKPVEIDVCSRVSIYLKNQDIMYYDLNNNVDVFNPSRVLNAIYTSNHCCMMYQDYLSKLDKQHYCQLSVDMTTGFLRKIVSNISRRLSQNLEMVMVYECIGNGKDLCDVTSTKIQLESPKLITEANDSLSYDSLSPSSSLSHDSLSPSSSLSHDSLSPSSSLSHDSLSPSSSFLKGVVVNNGIREKLNFSIITIIFILNSLL